jgi:predicted dehydrogenase
MSNNIRITRRMVLRSAVAAVAAPYVVPATVLGRAARAAAGDRMTLGIIGLGNMASNHIGWFLENRETQIVAVCDVDADKREAARHRIEEAYAAERAAGTYRGCDTYNEYEVLLARDDIDAVVIATPDHWHAIIAIASCRAGKDVYCEKPLSLTIREARAMVRAARRYGTVFQTGSQQRSAANFRRACALVRSGRIGKLKTVTVNVGEPSREKYLPAEPVPNGLDWDRWLGPAPWQPYSAERRSGSYGSGWRRIRDYSGGMMTDWGAHHFDIAQWGMGTDHTGPIEVLPPHGEDPKWLTYRYANGVTMVKGAARGILFTGTDGKVEVNRGYFKTWPDAIGEEPLGPGDVHLYESANHGQNWLDCIRTRARPICDVEIGCRSVTVCHLGNLAFWLKRPIRWDPEREEILDDAYAARWLDRPRRAPWHLHLYK